MVCGWMTIPTILESRLGSTRLPFRAGWRATLSCERDRERAFGDEQFFYYFLSVSAAPGELLCPGASET